MWNLKEFVYFWRLKNYHLKVSCENNLIHEKIMDAFKTHEQVISNYRSYLSSFLNIADERIKEECDANEWEYTEDGELYLYWAGSLRL